MTLAGDEILAEHAYLVERGVRPLAITGHVCVEGSELTLCSLSAEGRMSTSPSKSLTRHPRMAAMRQGGTPDGRQTDLSSGGSIGGRTA